jgi:hypothetical protein
MIVIFCVFLMVFAVLPISPVLGYSEDEARVTVEAAEAEVSSCYEAVFEADKAAADVSELLSILNNASWFLSRAKLAYSEGDSDSAVSFANECSSRLNGFVVHAEDLKKGAELAGNLDFMVNFVGSSVGAVCVVVGGFALWNFLKRREEKAKGTF